MRSTGRLSLAHPGGFQPPWRPVPGTGAAQARWRRPDPGTAGRPGALSAVASPALTGALHPRRHQDPVGGLHGSGTDRVARGGGVRVVHAVPVAAQEARLPPDVAGSPALRRQMPQRAGHPADAPGVVGRDMPPPPGPGRSLCRVRAEGGVGRGPDVLGRVPETDRHDIGAQRLQEGPVVLRAVGHRRRPQVGVAFQPVRRLGLQLGLQARLAPLRQPSGASALQHAAIGVDQGHDPA